MRANGAGQRQRWRGKWRPHSSCKVILSIAPTVATTVEKPCLPVISRATSSILQQALQSGRRSEKLRMISKWSL
eukprot:2144805-Amphidinium_carterae.1